MNKHVKNNTSTNSVRAKNKLVPKLRFSEFKDSGEWKETNLGECLLKHPEYGINAPAVPYSDELPTYLRITDISEDGRFLTSQKVSVDREITEDNYLVNGDIVLARTGASVGKSYKYREKDGKLVFAGFLIRVKPDKNKLNSELLSQFLSTEYYWRWVSLISARSGQPGINGAEYALMPLSLPPKIDEQQKIADCLSSIDDLITAENQKLESLKTHKKGLMQNLFPNRLHCDSCDEMMTMIKEKNHSPSKNQKNHSPDNVPNLRFKEFKNSGEWKEATLGQKDVSSFVNEKVSIEKLRLTTYVSTENIIPNYGGVTTASKLPPSGSFTRFKEGDILISNIRPYLKKVWFSDTEGAASNDVIVVRAGSKLSVAFLSTLLKNDTFINYVMKGAQGVKMPRGDKSLMQEYPILFPEKPEQQKIADCLSSLDDLITARSQKIEALKEHKKGLMQGLFPKLS